MASQERLLRVNPFRPGKILTGPELFRGRRPQLQTGLRLLVQAANGNSRHHLISGERGMGKSSLASQIEGFARGDDAYLALVETTSNEFRFQFLVATYVAAGGETPAALCAALLGELDRARRPTRLRVDWTLKIDLKVIQANIKPTEAPAQAATLFLDALDKTWAEVRNDVDGILIVIDEMDQIAGNSGIAAFLKVATEGLARRKLDHIVLVPVGVTGVVEKLTEGHPSSARVFQLIDVPLFDATESREIVEKALDGSRVSSTPAATQRIIELAAGVPNNIHLLGYYAFEADMNDEIDVDDVEAAIPPVVSEQLREKFTAMYLKAGGGVIRRVLKSLANAPDREVARDMIFSGAKVTDAEGAPNLSLLMAKEIIERTDTGVYRVRDPLFREYVRYVTLHADEEPVERVPRKRGSMKTETRP